MHEPSDITKIWTGLAAQSQARGSTEWKAAEGGQREPSSWSRFSSATLGRSPSPSSQRFLIEEVGFHRFQGCPQLWCLRSSRSVLAVPQGMEVKGRSTTAGGQEAAPQGLLCHHAASTTMDTCPTCAQRSVSVSFPLQVFSHSRLSSFPAQFWVGLWFVYVLSCC